MIAPGDEQQARIEALPNRRQEAILFRRHRWLIALATLRGLFRESFLRLLLITALTLIFWGLMFGLFYEGFSLLASTVSHAPTLARTVHAVYNVFFLSLLFMLSVSSGILFYAAIYKTPEINLLLTIPARTERIAHDKFFEATLLACWGFILLGSPLLVAYGIVNSSPPAYFILLLPLLISFAVIPSGIGALVCLLLVAIAPRLRQAALTLVVTAMVVAAGYVTYSVLGGVSSESLTGLWLQQALGKLKIAEQRALPSWWLSTALLEAAHGGPKGVLQALGFQSVLLSNALLIPRLVGFVGGKTLRKSVGHLRQSSRQLRPRRFAAIDALTHRLLIGFSPTVRLVLGKDLRLFRRDPLQWSQFILFFGLLSFYFIYVRRFDYGSQLT